MRQLFLANAAVVRNAVADERVAAAWNDESILAGQSIGVLAGHLARGAVWVVGEYLAAGSSEGPVDYETAAAYFADVASSLTDADHVAVRERGAAVAADGHAHVVAKLTTRLDALRASLPSEPADRLVAVFGGKVMRLDDYLWTRLVEQVVHLDDLARSLEIEPWIYAPDAEALVISCGAEIGRQRLGGAAMIRALFRGHDGALPVM